MLHEHVGRPAPHEREPSRQHAVERDSQAVHILHHGLRDGGRERFGSQVIGRAEELVGHRSTGRGFGRPHEAQVEQFHFAGKRDENVLRLDVAVGEAVALEVPHGVGCLPRDPHRPAERQALFDAQLVLESSPLGPFKDEIGHVGVRFRAEQFQQVPAGDRLAGLHFVVHKLPGDRLVAPFGPQALERTETPGGRLHRLPHFGERSHPGQLDRLEAARERKIGSLNVFVNRPMTDVGVTDVFSQRHATPVQLGN